MSLRTALLAGTTLLVLAGASNAAALRGTYIAIEGGGNWIGDNDVKQTTALNGVVTNTQVLSAQFETGWALLASLGYAFDNHLRAELEAGYRRNNIDSLVTILPAPGVASPAGDVSEFSLMANLLYDFHLGDKLTLSLGGGIGADRAHLKASTLAFSDDEWVLAYQGIAGLSYAIGDRTQLFVNYRYLHADAPEYMNALAANKAQRTAFLSDLEKHTATLGIRFALRGGDTAPAPMASPAAPEPQAAPPAPPAPPTAPPQFVVFFGLASADLVPEAERVVRDAASAARDFGSATVTIVGHTDSAGSTAANQRLSERRAAAVRNALVREGIPAAKISATGTGEAELTVRTGDGVKEPQNRRATIDLH